MNVLGIVRITAEFDFDSNGKVVSKHWLFPETAEILYGGLASLIIFAVLIKFGGPAVKKAFAARTERIQAELDGAANARQAAEVEAAQIRQAKGDIEAERARMLAEAEEQAALVLSEGRARLDQEVAELEARATADIATAGTRVADELRAEIARLTSAAVDHVVTGSLDDATQQELIESFISRVGASA